MNRYLDVVLPAQIAVLSIMTTGCVLGGADYISTSALACMTTISACLKAWEAM